MATGHKTSPRACCSQVASQGWRSQPHESRDAQAFLIKEEGHPKRLAFFPSRKERSNLHVGSRSWDSCLHSCWGQAEGGCLASVAGGRGVLQDKQGWLLPAVPCGGSQCDCGKQWLLNLGALGRWGAASVVWVAAGVPKSCSSLAAAAMLGGPNLYD